VSLSGFAFPQKTQQPYYQKSKHPSATTIAPLRPLPNNGVRKGWLPTFGEGGCRRSKRVVADVRKGWFAHAMSDTSSCHERYLLMA
ncbi:MAG: hypothetical protein IJ269_07775, partial [Bacteroidales bacterium]|nr:hypothetical protein [Bacteroidales bacterium]